MKFTGSVHIGLNV